MAEELSDDCAEGVTDALADSDSDGTFVRDGNGDSETLGVTHGLAETDAETVSLYEGVFKSELLANGVRDGITDDV